MPIPVRCPNCNAKLNAPDAAAGRRVKCPKCETKIPVPAASEGSGASPALATPTPAAPPPLPPPPASKADSGSPFDFSSSEPPPASPAASAAAPPAGAAPAFDFGAAAEAGAGKSSRGEARRPARPADDEDDGEEAPEPPRRGGRRRPPPQAPEGKKSGSPLVLILVIAAVAFLGCCVGLPLGIYLYLAPKVEEASQKFQEELDKAARDAAKKDTVPGGDKAPPGWKEYAAIEGTFKGYFPADVQEEAVEPLKLKGIKGPVRVMEYRSVASDGSVMVVVRVLRFDATMNPAFRATLMRAHKSEVLDSHKAAPRPESQKAVTWQGEPTTETVHEISDPEWSNGKVVVRDVMIENMGYIATIKGKDGRPGPEIEDGFFETFEATAK